MTDAELVISVLVSIKVFAVRHRTNSPWRACANFRPLWFVPQSAGLLECALPARRVRASSRRFLREKAVDRTAMRRRLALPTLKAFARPHFPPRRAGSA